MRLFLFLLCTFSIKAFAFPEMIRHGYTHCTACHVSPTGGGVLTPYGRSLAREILSTWGSEGESEFLYGAVKPPEWISFGGEIRALQLHQDTPTVTKGRFIFMQFDVEAAATFGKWTVDATVGLDRGPTTGTAKWSDYLISRRFYLKHQFNEHFSLRAGRFYPAFGIHTADHVLVTRKGLGWDFGAEAHNIEAAWLYDNFDVFLTALMGRMDVSPNPGDKGVAIRPALAITDSSKIGMNYLFGESSLRNRHILGAFAMLGFTPRLFLLAEVDLCLMTNLSTLAKTTKVVSYLRLNREWVQGVHSYLTLELSEPDTNLPGLFHGVGAGLQFFPRPHLEVNMSWNLQKDTASEAAYSHYAWLLLHFYL